MGDKGNLQAVLGDVFGAYVAHQRPAANQFQAGEMGKKMALGVAHGNVMPVAVMELTIMRQK
ncbi:hypothetical protein JFPO14_contig00003-0353 [Edwardsiella piscicida]|nr:hypothetical protein JFPO13_contig00002-0086 [Edwardsiella piscicida]GBK57155.1 hypothetical protein JFPO14_contig00003-0353 [Edwardsiella piscicida]